MPLMGGTGASVPEVVHLPRAGPHAVIEGDIILGAVTTDGESGVDAVAPRGIMGAVQVLDAAWGGAVTVANVSGGSRVENSDVNYSFRRLDIQRGFDA